MSDTSKILSPTHSINTISVIHLNKLSSSVPVSPPTLPPSILPSTLPTTLPTILPTFEQFLQSKHFQPPQIPSINENTNIYKYMPMNVFPFIHQQSSVPLPSQSVPISQQPTNQPTFQPPLPIPPYMQLCWNAQIAEYARAAAAALQNTSQTQVFCNPPKTVNKNIPTHHSSHILMNNRRDIHLLSKHIGPTHNINVCQFNPYELLPKKQPGLRANVYVSKSCTKELSEYIVDEEWGKEYGQLYKYLDYIFRCQIFEKKVSHILYNNRHEIIIFHTGLQRRSDTEFLYLFAVKNDAEKQNAQQEWRVPEGDIKESCLTHDELLTKLYLNKGVGHIPLRTKFYDNLSQLLFNEEYTVDVNWNERLRTNQARFRHCFNKDILSSIDNDSKDDDEYKHSIGKIDDKNIKMYEEQFDKALHTSVSKAKSNPRLAIAQAFVETKKKKSRVELLLPLYVEWPKNSNNFYTFALALKEVECSGGCGRKYQGMSLLTMEMAYANARLIGYVDSSWLKNTCIAVAEDKMAVEKKVHYAMDKYRTEHKKDMEDVLRGVLNEKTHKVQYRSDYQTDSGGYYPSSRANLDYHRPKKPYYYGTHTLQSLNEMDQIAPTPASSLMRRPRPARNLYDNPSPTIIETSSHTAVNILDDDPAYESLIESAIIAVGEEKHSSYTSAPADSRLFKSAIWLSDEHKNINDADMLLLPRTPPPSNTMDVLDIDHELDHSRSGSGCRNISGDGSNAGKKYLLQLSGLPSNTQVNIIRNIFDKYSKYLLSVHYVDDDKLAIVRFSNYQSLISAKEFTKSFPWSVKIIKDSENLRFCECQRVWQYQSSRWWNAYRESVSQIIDQLIVGDSRVRIRGQVYIISKFTINQGSQFNIRTTNRRMIRCVTMRVWAPKKSELRLDFNRKQNVLPLNLIPSQDAYHFAYNAAYTHEYGHPHSHQQKYDIRNMPYNMYDQHPSNSDSKYSVIDVDNEVSLLQPYTKKKHRNKNTLYKKSSIHSSEIPAVFKPLNATANIFEPKKYAVSLPPTSKLFDNKYSVSATVSDVRTDIFLWKHIFKFEDDWKVFQSKFHSSFSNFVLYYFEDDDETDGYKNSDKNDDLLAYYCCKSWLVSCSILEYGFVGAKKLDKIEFYDNIEQAVVSTVSVDDECCDGYGNMRIFECTIKVDDNGSGCCVVRKEEMDCTISTTSIYCAEVNKNEYLHSLGVDVGLDAVVDNMVGKSQP